MGGADPCAGFFIFIRIWPYIAHFWPKSKSYDVTIRQPRCRGGAILASRLIPARPSPENLAFRGKGSVRGPRGWPGGRSVALAGIRRELLELARLAVPILGVGRRIALDGDVRPALGVLGVELEP